MKSSYCYTVALSWIMAWNRICIIETNDDAIFWRLRVWTTKYFPIFRVYHQEIWQIPQQVLGKKLYPETLKHIPLLLLIKQKSGQDLAVFLLNWLVCMEIADDGSRSKLKATFQQLLQQNILKNPISHWWILFWVLVCHKHVFGMIHRQYSEYITYLVHKLANT